MLRKPSVNPDMKLKSKLKILWRPELAQIQEKYGMAKYKEKSKDFVIEKICDLVPDVVATDELSQTVSSILFERDYSKVTETLAEYRKGELQKKIETETDSRKKLELMMAQAEKRGSFTKKHRRKKK